MARFVRKETSAVAVLVDDTMSMRWQDRYPDAGDRAALAALTGLPQQQFDGEDRPSRTELVRRALLRQEGILTRLAEDHPLLFFRFGVSARDAKTYIEPLGETEERRRGAPSLRRQTPPPADAALTTARAALDKLEAGGYHTNLARAMREMLNRLEGRRLSAVVVVSDGQNTGRRAEWRPRVRRAPDGAPARHSHLRRIGR